jgi:hypothetical protein
VSAPTVGTLVLNVHVGAAMSVHDAHMMGAALAFALRNAIAHTELRGRNLAEPGEPVFGELVLNVEVKPQIPLTSEPKE